MITVDIHVTRSKVM